MALIPNGDVSYGYKECEQMRALIGNGGSINRLQVYIGDTNVNWGIVIQ